ncbi:hypothetical protein JCM10213_006306 [Rhodosporidiobolus nylandii]
MFSGNYPSTSPASWSRETSFLQQAVAKGQPSLTDSAVVDEEGADEDRGRIGKRRSFGRLSRSSMSTDSRLSPTEEGSESEDEDDTITLPGTAREAADQHALMPPNLLPPATERTPLLATGAPLTRAPTAADEAAVREAQKLNDDRRDAYMSEAKTLAGYTVPILGTHFLEFSLTASTVLFLGHLGETELAAASLGNMTNNFLALSVIQGFCAALDSLCPQAFTSDNPSSTSLFAIRTWLITLVIFIPQAIAFWFSEYILRDALHQHPDVAYLASRYLRVLIPALPAYAGFEVIRRWLQAQGRMNAPVVALFVAAPVNLLLNYLLIWGPVDALRLGFLGAPVATAVSIWLMFVVLVVYSILRAPREAWGGFGPEAFEDLGLNVKLGLAGVAMVGSEWWSWEIVSLATSFLGPTALAAQSVLLTSASAFYQFQYALSVAAAVRVGNLLGAQKPHLARVASRVTIAAATFMSGVNSLLLILLRNKWGHLFSSEPEIITMVAAVLPLVAAFQLWDGLSGAMSGVLRGAGKPTLGAIINVSSYYIIGIPLGLAVTFGPIAHYGLNGLWLGLTAALTFTGVSSTYIVWRMDWEGEAEATRIRLGMAKRDAEE